MKNFICRIFGHKPKEGPLQRSPYTVYTHWTDTYCSRCGTRLGGYHHYIDALTKPEYYREGYEKLPVPGREGARA